MAGSISGPSRFPAGVQRLAPGAFANSRQTNQGPILGFALELVTKRECSDALSGGRENGVAQGRRQGRYRHFAHTRGPVRAVDDVNIDMARAFVHAHHPVAVEIRLLDSAVLDRDFLMQRRRQGVVYAALHLRAHAFGIDRETISVPLEKEGDGSVSRQPDGTIEIIVPAATPVRHWLPTLRTSLQELGFEPSDDDAESWPE